MKLQKIIACAFNTDTACVEVKYSDGARLSIYTPGVEDGLNTTLAMRTEIDWLIYNKPLEYFVLSIISFKRNLWSFCGQHKNKNPPNSLISRGLRDYFLKNTTPTQKSRPNTKHISLVIARDSHSSSFIYPYYLSLFAFLLSECYQADYVPRIRLTSFLLNTPTDFVQHLPTAV